MTLLNSSGPILKFHSLISFVTFGVTSARLPMIPLTLQMLPDWFMYRFSRSCSIQHSKNFQTCSSNVEIPFMVTVLISGGNFVPPLRRSKNVGTHDSLRSIEK